MLTVRAGPKEDQVFIYEDVILKECAHCGGEPTWGVSLAWAHISCKECNTKIVVDKWSKMKFNVHHETNIGDAWLEAVEIWNRREKMKKDRDEIVRIFERMF